MVPNKSKTDQNKQQKPKLQTGANTQGPNNQTHNAIMPKNKNKPLLKPLASVCQTKDKPDAQEDFRNLTSAVQFSDYLREQRIKGRIEADFLERIDLNVERLNSLLDFNPRGFAQTEDELIEKKDESSLHSYYKEVFPFERHIARLLSIPLNEGQRVQLKKLREEAEQLNQQVQQGAKQLDTNDNSFLNQAQGVVATEKQHQETRKSLFEQYHHFYISVLSDEIVLLEKLSETGGGVYAGEGMRKEFLGKFLSRLEVEKLLLETIQLKEFYLIESDPNRFYLREKFVDIKVTKSNSENPVDQYFNVLVEALNHVKAPIIKTEKDLLISQIRAEVAGIYARENSSGKKQNIELPIKNTDKTLVMLRRRVVESQEYQRIKSKKSWKFWSNDKKEGEVVENEKSLNFSEDDDEAKKKIEAYFDRLQEIHLEEQEAKVNCVKWFGHLNSRELLKYAELFKGMRDDLNLLNGLRYEWHQQNPQRLLARKVISDEYKSRAKGAMENIQYFNSGLKYYVEDQKRDLRRWEQALAYQMLKLLKGSDKDPSLDDGLADELTQQLKQREQFAQALQTEEKFLQSLDSQASHGLTASRAKELNSYVSERLPEGLVKEYQDLLEDSRSAVKLQSYYNGKDVTAFYQPTISIEEHVDFAPSKESLWRRSQYFPVRLMGYIAFYFKAAFAAMGIYGEEGVTSNLVREMAPSLVALNHNTRIWKHLAELSKNQQKIHATNKGGVQSWYLGLGDNAKHRLRNLTTGENRGYFLSGQYLKANPKSERETGVATSEVLLTEADKFELLMGSPEIWAFVDHLDLIDEMGRILDETPNRPKQAWLIRLCQNIKDHPWWRKILFWVPVDTYMVCHEYENMLLNQKKNEDYGNQLSSVLENINDLFKKVIDSRNRQKISKKTILECRAFFRSLKAHQSKYSTQTWAVELNNKLNAFENALRISARLLAIIKIDESNFSEDSKEVKQEGGFLKLGEKDELGRPILEEETFISIDHFIENYGDPSLKESAKAVIKLIKCEALPESDKDFKTLEKHVVKLLSYEGRHATDQEVKDFLRKLVRCYVYPRGAMSENNDDAMQALKLLERYDGQGEDSSYEKWRRALERDVKSRFDNLRDDVLYAAMLTKEVDLFTSEELAKKTGAMHPFEEITYKEFAKHLKKLYEVAQNRHVNKLSLVKQHSIDEIAKRFVTNYLKGEMPSDVEKKNFQNGGGYKGDNNRYAPFATELEKYAESTGCDPVFEYGKRRLDWLWSPDQYKSNDSNCNKDIYHIEDSDPANDLETDSSFFSDNKGNQKLINYLHLKIKSNYQGKDLAYVEIINAVNCDKHKNQAVIAEYGYKRAQYLVKNSLRLDLKFELMKDDLKFFKKHESNSLLQTRMIEVMNVYDGSDNKAARLIAESSSDAVKAVYLAKRLEFLLENTFEKGSNQDCFTLNDQGAFSLPTEADLEVFRKWSKIPAVQEKLDDVLQQKTEVLFKKQSKLEQNQYLIEMLHQSDYAGDLFSSIVLTLGRESRFNYFKQRLNDLFVYNDSRAIGFFQNQCKNNGYQYQEGLQTLGKQVDTTAFAPWYEGFEKQAKEFFETYASRLSSATQPVVVFGSSINPKDHHWNGNTQYLYECYFYNAFKDQDGLALLRLMWFKYLSLKNCGSLVNVNAGSDRKYHEKNRKNDTQLSLKQFFGHRNIDSFLDTAIHFLESAPLTIPSDLLCHLVKLPDQSGYYMMDDEILKNQSYVKKMDKLSKLARLRGEELDLHKQLDIGSYNDACSTFLTRAARSENEIGADTKDQALLRMRNIIKEHAKSLIALKPSNEFFNVWYDLIEEGVRPETNWNHCESALNTFKQSFINQFAENGPHSQFRAELLKATDHSSNFKQLQEVYIFYTQFLFEAATGKLTIALLTVHNAELWERHLSVGMIEAIDLAVRYLLLKLDTDSEEYRLLEAFLKVFTLKSEHPDYADSCKTVKEYHEKTIPQQLKNAREQLELIQKFIENQTTETAGFFSELEKPLKALESKQHYVSLILTPELMPNLASDSHSDKSEVKEKPLSQLNQKVSVVVEHLIKLASKKVDINPAAKLEYLKATVSFLRAMRLDLESECQLKNASQSYLMQAFSLLNPIRPDFDSKNVDNDIKHLEYCVVWVNAFGTKVQKQQLKEQVSGVAVFAICDSQRTLACKKHYVGDENLAKLIKVVNPSQGGQLFDVLSFLKQKEELEESAKKAREKSKMYCNQLKEIGSGHQKTESKENNSGETHQQILIVNKELIKTQLLAEQNRAKEIEGKLSQLSRPERFKLMSNSETGSVSRSLNFELSKLCNMETQLDLAIEELSKHIARDSLNVKNALLSALEDKHKSDLITSAGSLDDIKNAWFSKLLANNGFNFDFDGMLKDAMRSNLFNTKTLKEEQEAYSLGKEETSLFQLYRLIQLRKQVRQSYGEYVELMAMPSDLDDKELSVLTGQMKKTQGEILSKQKQNVSENPLIKKMLNNEGSLGLLFKKTKQQQGQESRGSLGKPREQTTGPAAPLPEKTGFDIKKLGSSFGNFFRLKSETSPKPTTTKIGTTPSLGLKSTSTPEKVPTQQGAQNQSPHGVLKSQQLKKG